MLICNSRSGTWTLSRSILWLSGLALATEITEAIVYGHKLEWNDVGSDLVGVLAGLGILRLRQMPLFRGRVCRHGSRERRRSAFALSKESGSQAPCGITGGDVLDPAHVALRGLAGIQLLRRTSRETRAIE
jgi:hypothetical protein